MTSSFVSVTDAGNILQVEKRMYFFARLFAIQSEHAVNCPFLQQVKRTVRPSFVRSWNICKTNRSSTIRTPSSFRTRDERQRYAPTASTAVRVTIIDGRGERRKLQRGSPRNGESGHKGLVIVIEFCLFVTLGAGQPNRVPVAGVNFSHAFPFAWLFAIRLGRS